MVMHATPTSSRGGSGSVVVLRRGAGEPCGRTRSEHRSSRRSSRRLRVPPPRPHRGLLAPCRAPWRSSTCGTAPPRCSARSLYQRRLSRELMSGCQAIDVALAVAREHGVMASGEILEGAPGPLIAAFAQHRRAPLIVVGRSRRRLGRTVAGAVDCRTDRPLLVAPTTPVSPAGGSASARRAGSLPARRPTSRRRGDRSQERTTRSSGRRSHRAQAPWAP